MDTQIEKLLKEARNSISNFCINECKAKCCKRGKLILLNKEEINFITQENPEKFEKENILLKTKDGNSTFNIEESKCPYLTNDFKCSTWEHENRPRVCKDYPIFKVNNEFIIFSDTCPAEQNKMFENYKKEIKKLGFKII